MDPSIPKEQMATENTQAGFIARNSILSKATKYLELILTRPIFSEKRLTIASYLRKHALFGGFADEERAQKLTMRKISKLPRGCESASEYY